MQVKFSNILLGLGVGLFAGNAVALSLGEAHGRVLLGRPIDLVFDIYTDPGTELDVACVQVSGQAGETRIDSSRLRITAQPVIAGRPPSVRIRSSMVVVEPILTLRLAVGCSGVVARTYDFFADVPAEVPASALPLVIAPPATLREATQTKDVAVRAPARAPVVAPTEASPQSVTPPPKPAKARKPPKEQAAAQADVAATSTVPTALTAPTASAAPAKTAAAAPPRSRLKVEPLGDWLAEPAPAELRLSPSLQQLPQEAPNEQRTQAAALWQTLNSAAEYVEQTQVRLQQQQAEIDASRASHTKMQLEVTELQQRIARLDSERPSTALMYVLLGLLVLAFALLGWLWQRLRRQTTLQRTEPDWNYPASLHTKDFAGTPSTPQSSDFSPLEPAFSRAVVKVVEPVAAAAPVPDALPTEPLDLPPMAPALVPVLAAAVRMLHPEELFDLQQQADFFVSVGEHDQAIEVMKKHIAENETASPLMYLELLRLYHSLSRRDDFKRLRAQFQQHFNALVPEFAAFNGAGRTLLDYPEAAASIEAVWSDAAVLPLLESYIFCRSAGRSVAAERFDLPAYDDLLLLYAVANTTPASARGAPPPRQRTMPYAEAVLAPSSMPAPEPLASLALEEPLERNRLSRDFLSPELLSAVDAGRKRDVDDVDVGLFLDMDRPVTAGAELDLEPEVMPPPLSNLMEYDAPFLSDETLSGPATEPSPDAAEQVWSLDLDLSEPDFLSMDLSPSPQSDAPAAPATPPPAPGQPIGFGAISDRFEARFDLDENDPKSLKF